MHWLLDAWSSNNTTLWHLAGWTMCGFLLTGTLVAIAGGMIRLLCRRAVPAVRYGVSLASLLLLACAPLVIGGWLYQWMPDSAPLANEVIVELESAPLDSEATLAPLRNDLVEATRPESEAVLGGWELASEKVTASLPEVPDSEMLETNREGNAQEVAINHWLQCVLEYLPWVWLVGTPITFLLLATGLVGSARLRRQCEMVSTGIVVETRDRLQRSLRMTRQVGIAVCDRIAQPVLVGIVRPLILLPPAALTGWSPEEIEMVLLHELAHVRRWDNLVNFLQRVIESVLFFHPAVWLVSRQVRLDREQCCDAVVVAHTAQPQAYAELLVNIAASSGKAAPLATASALADHPLAGRIRWILNLEEEPMLISRGTLGALMLVVTVLVSVMLWQPVTETIAEEELATTSTEVAEDVGITAEDAEKSVEVVDLNALAWDESSVDEFSLNYEALLSKIQQLRSAGKSPQLKLSSAGIPDIAAVEGAESVPMEVDQNEAIRMLQLLVVEPGQTNPIRTKRYLVPEVLQEGAESLLENFKTILTPSLEIDLSQPRYQFKQSLLQEGKVIELTAPTALHWQYQAQLLLADYSARLLLGKLEAVGALPTESNISSDDQAERRPEIYMVTDLDRIPLLEWSKIVNANNGATVRWGESLDHEIVIEGTEEQHGKIRELLKQIRDKKGEINSDSDVQKVVDYGITAENAEKEYFDLEIGFPNAIQKGEPERIAQQLTKQGYTAKLQEDSIRDGIHRQMTVQIPKQAKPRVTFEKKESGEWICHIYDETLFPSVYSIKDISSVPLIEWTKITARDGAVVSWKEKGLSELEIVADKEQHRQIRELLERVRETKKEGLATEAAESTEGLLDHETQTAGKYLEKLARQFRELKMAGKEFAVKPNKFRVPILAETGDTVEPVSISESEARDSLMNLLFQSSHNNPAEIQRYLLPEKLRRDSSTTDLGTYLNDLQNREKELEFDFQWHWENNGEAILVETTVCGHWVLSKTLHTMQLLEMTFSSASDEVTTEDAVSTEERRLVAEQVVVKDGKKQIVVEPDNGNEASVDVPLIPTEPAPAVFLPLEQQRKIDLVFKTVGIEVRQLNANELEVAKANHFEGGVLITTSTKQSDFHTGDPLTKGDILVGLHSWPTKSINDVVEILQREDIAELSPLKFIVLRQTDSPFDKKDKYKLVTGRVAVNVEALAAKPKVKSATDHERRVELPLDLQIQELELEVDFARKHFERTKEVLETQKTLYETGSAPLAELRKQEIARDEAELQFRKLEIQLSALDKQQALQKKPAATKYDGRTFEEWRELWKTELKIDKRVDCIRALAAFGKTGRAEEAVETILDVAREYDFERIDGPENAIKENIQEWLYELPTSIWLSQLLERYDSDEKKWLHFTRFMLGDSRISVDVTLVGFFFEIATSDRNIKDLATNLLFRSDRTIKQPQTEKLVRQCLQGEPKDFSRAMLFLEFRHLDKFPEQVDFLFHDSPGARRLAFSCFMTPKKESEFITAVDKLLEVVNDPQKSQYHIRAIRILGRLRNTLQVPEAELVPLIERIQKTLLNILANGNEDLLGPAIAAYLSLPDTDIPALKQILHTDFELSEERRKVFSNDGTLVSLITEENSTISMSKDLKN